MSQLIQSLVAALRMCDNPEVRRVASSEHDDDHSAAQSQPVKKQSRLVEGKTIGEGISVGSPETGMISHFMDGMQRVYVPLTVGFVPLVYGYVSAVIRMRGQDRRMRTHAHQLSEAVYCPLDYADIKWLNSESVTVIDTSSEIRDGNDNVLAFLEYAKSKIGHSREKLETDLVDTWLDEYKNADNWLLVDGSLCGRYDEYRDPNIVGVIKSHQTQYFDLEDQKKIINLPVGFRSQIFIPIGSKRPEVYSWYLRMRSNEGLDPYFGLVRIEAAACERTMEMADILSRQLLAERAPLSLPDYRWDKLIYPIHDCEQYLKSIAPSWTVLRSAFSGII